MKNKKNIIIISSIILAFLGIILSWLYGWGIRKNDQQLPIAQENPETEQNSQKTISPENEPNIKFDVANDRSGGDLTINNIDTQFSELEYELIYLATSDEGMEIERGVAGGPIEISKTGKVTENILFGTESCTTGKCNRHVDKNVSGGTLVIYLLTSKNETWTMEKEFTFEKSGSGYETVWK